MFVLPAVIAALVVRADAAHPWGGVAVGLAIEVGALLLWAGYHFGHDATRRFVRNWVFLLQWLTFVVVAVVVGRAKATMQFYTVAAQLIAVLLLAQVFQNSSVGPRWTSPNYGSIIFTVAAVVLGEVVALSAVFSGRPGGAALVCGAVGALLLGIVVQALIGRDDPQDPPPA
jgi:hypothetical protein